MLRLPRRSHESVRESIIMLKSPTGREYAVAVTCLLIGGAVGARMDFRTPPDQEAITLGLLLKSCLEDSGYERFISNLESPPIRILGTSGTDFENVYPERNEPYVANLTASERPGRGRVYYKIDYGMSDGAGRRTVEGFTVFLLDADNNSTLGVVYCSHSPLARDPAKPIAE
jgi:hypothetical protein